MIPHITNKIKMNIHTMELNKLKSNIKAINSQAILHQVQIKIKVKKRKKRKKESDIKEKTN